MFTMALISIQIGCSIVRVYTTLLYYFQLTRSLMTHVSDQLIGRLAFCGDVGRGVHPQTGGVQFTWLRRWEPCCKSKCNHSPTVRTLIIGNNSILKDFIADERAKWHCKGRPLKWTRDLHRVMFVTTFSVVLRRSDIYKILCVPHYFAKQGLGRLLTSLSDFSSSGRGIATLLSDHGEAFLSA